MFVCIVHCEPKLDIIQQMILSNFSLKLQAQYASSNNEVILSAWLKQAQIPKKKWKSYK